jgi:phage major head subunit gpT-like protein
MATVVSAIALERGLKTAFHQAHEAAAAMWPELATEVPSSNASEKYGWLGQVAGMREWKDERVPKGLVDHDYTIANKHWEDSIAVDRDNFEDDQYGMIYTRVRDLAARAKEHPDELVIDLLVEGDANDCYDGKKFFASDHAESADEYTTSQDNALTYDCTDHTAPTLAELKAAFIAARLALSNFKDGKGKLVNLRTTGLVVVCNPHIEVTFEELFTAARISGSDNVMKGAAKLMATPLYTETARFVLLKVDRPLKPLIFQNRQKVRMATTRGDATSDSAGFQKQGVEEFMRKHFFFGVDARYNVGYGDWRQAVETTLN